MPCDRKKLQFGFEIGNDFNPEIKRGLFPIDQSIREANRILHEKYDRTLNLKLVRKRPDRRKQRGK